MPEKRRAAAAVNRRKAKRRKPGDQRFPGRLIGKREGVSREKDRRSGERRKK